MGGPLLELCCENEVLGRSGIKNLVPEQPCSRLSCYEALLPGGLFPPQVLWSPGSAGITTSSPGEAASFSAF